MTRGGLSEHWVRSVGNVADSPSTAVWSEVVVLAIRSDLSHLTDRHVTARPPVRRKVFRGRRRHEPLCALVSVLDVPAIIVPLDKRCGRSRQRRHEYDVSLVTLL